MQTIIVQRRTLRNPPYPFDGHDTPCHRSKQVAADATGRLSSGRLRSSECASGGPSVAHRPLGIADVQEPNLALVDRGEGMGDERVQAGLVDRDVEDAAAAGWHRDGLDSVQCTGWAHVAERVGGVEYGADDVEVGVDRGPCVDDPEANQIARV